MPAAVGVSPDPIRTASGGSAGRAVERGLRRAVLAVSASWLIIIALTQVEHSTGALSWGLVAAAATAWILAAAGTPHGLSALLVTLIAGSVCESLLSVPSVLFLEVEPAVAWTILTVVCVGLYLPIPRAQIAVVAVAVGCMAALSLVAWRTGTWMQSWHQIVTLGLFGLGDGLATAAGTAALRRSAAASDAATETLHRLREEQAAQRARTNSATRARRLLHDTVVNTLLVVRRGVADVDLPALRARCAHDLATAGQLWGSVEDPSDCTAEELLHGLTTGAHRLDLDLNVDPRISSDGLIPAAVAHAIEAGIGEVLVNVVKHAGVREARLKLIWSGDLLSVEVEDDGRGWDGQIRTGHGLDVTVIQSAHAAGVAASVTATPGHGTRVRMVWEPTADVDEQDPLHPDRVLARAAVAIGGWITLMVAGVTALAWTVIASPGSLLTLGLLAATLAAGWWASRGRIALPVGWPVAVGLLATAAVATVLPAGNAATCEQVALGYFGGDAGIVVLLVLIALTRGVGWPAAGAALLSVGVLSYPLGTTLPPECQTLPSRLLILDLGIFLAALIAREVLLRFWGQALQRQQQAHEQRIATRISRAVQRSRDARLDRVLQSALPVLSAIASGDADPQDAAVRWQAQVQEEAIRAILLAGPNPTGVSEALLDAVVVAARHDASLTLTVLPATTVRCPAGLRRELALIAERLPPGSGATASVIESDDAAVLMMTVPRPLDISRLASMADISVDLVALGDLTLVEARWDL